MPQEENIAIRKSGVDAMLKVCAECARCHGQSTAPDDKSTCHLRNSSPFYHEGKWVFIIAMRPSGEERPSSTGAWNIIPNPCMQIVCEDETKARMIQSLVEEDLPDHLESKTRSLEYIWNIRISWRTAREILMMDGLCITLLHKSGFNECPFYAEQLISSIVAGSGKSARKTGGRKPRNASRQK